MPKYAVAYFFFILSSFSIVSASVPSHVIQVRQQTDPTVPVVTPPSTPTTQNTQDTTLSRGPSTVPNTASSVATTAVTSTSPSQNAPTQPSRSSQTNTITPSSSSTTATSESAAKSPITTTSTDPAGQVVTTVVATVAPSTSSSSATLTPTQAANTSDSSIKPGTIIGISVVGGIAVIALIAFIIWKLTRKRFSDFDDPDEAIKWPELRRESPTGGDNLSRQFSNAPSRNTSALDQSEYADPYAVPPLPQFNPNQPYRDDPGPYAASPYYDPYRGPVPQSLHDGSTDGHESIPMSTYPPGSRTRSPAPGPAYDLGGPATGRASPAPGVPYDIGGRGSPAPGRTMSPGPAVAFGTDRRPSPAPQLSLSGQPEMAFRKNTPGPPNILG